MSWLLLTLLAVIVFSSSNLFHRLLMKDEQSDPYAQSIVFFSIAGVFALVFSFFHGGFQYQITANQFLLFLPLALCTTVGPVLLFKSFQLIDASENAILQSSQKLWTVLGAFLFLHELFSSKKLIGTIITIIGIAIALWNKRRVILNKGVLLVFMATLFYSGADLISFYLVRDFDPFSLIVYVCFLPVITLLLIKPKTIKKIAFYFKPKYALFVSILGLSDTLGTACTYYAYQIGRNAAQITPILAMITIISVLMGIVFLKERSNIPNKILGALATVVGVLLVI